MEQEYSVGVQNRYAFLDEDDPGDIQSAAKLPKELKEVKPTKAKEKIQQPSKTSSEQNKPEKTTTTTTNNQRAPRNERNDRRENKKNAGSNVRDGDEEEGVSFSKESHPPRKSAGRQRLNSKEQESKEQGEPVPQTQGGDSLENRPFQNNRGPRRGGFENRGGAFEGKGGAFEGKGGAFEGKGEGPREGRGGGGGGGGFREGGRGGKREFERRSGSDKSSVKPIEKREGGGSHNWGNVKDEVELRNEWAEESEAVVPKVANGVVPEEKGEEGGPVTEGEQKKEEGEVKAEEGEQAPAEEEDKEMTYEEYMALKSKTRAKPEYQERKVNQTEEGTQWKGAIPLEKKDEEFFSGTREIVEKPKTSGRVKTVVTDTSFYFKDPARRGGGGFGGRGRGFGGGDQQEKLGQGEGGGGFRERRGDRGFSGNRGGAPRSFTSDRNFTGEREKGEQRQQQGEEGESTARGRGGRGRGGRGGGRPYAENAGRGRNVRGGGRERAPNVDDERDFPSLSSAAPGVEKSEP